SKAHELFNKAQEEFLSERYENIPDIIEEAYKTISEESALDTRIKTFYLLSTATIINFFKINWKEIVSIIWILIILYWLLNKKIRIMFIDRKIKNAKLEITVLKNLIKRTQEEYFHLFNIPEELYFIRVEKFSEFIRNLNSRLPLLMEKRATLQGLEETGEKIPLRERVKEKFKNLFSVFKKKEKGPGLLEPPQAKEERIEEPKKGFWYLLRHIYSFKRFKSALGEIKQKKEEKKKRIETMKNIKKEEIVRKKEEKKRMKKIIQLKKEREEEILKTKKKEQRVLFMAGLIKRIKSIFKKSSHIKLRKSKVIKGIKQRSKAKLSKIDKERKDKEQEYLWFLLKERDKKIEEPQENNSIEPEQKIQEIKKKKSKKNRERKKS
ncbi:MAG: hypothetical protein KKA65_02915, partial [Nanoarchaeota archaeon]|nr:hypothetical protein [Nanoarchaeota archaeon]